MGEREEERQRFAEERQRFEERLSVASNPIGVLQGVWHAPDHMLRVDGMEWIKKYMILEYGGSIIHLSGTVLKFQQTYPSNALPAGPEDADLQASWVPNFLLLMRSAWYFRLDWMWHRLTFYDLSMVVNLSSD